MAKYKVEWEQEIDSAEGPLEAAKLAFEEIHNEDSLAFTVTRMATDERFSVDLNEEDGEQVSQIE